MKIQPLRYNIYTSFCGSEKKYYPQILEGIEICEADIKNTPYYHTTFEDEKLNYLDIKRISTAIKGASKYKKGDDGYPKIKTNYLASFYDLPISYAINLKEMQKNGENTHITDEIPKMFEGLDIEKVCDCLDCASLFLGGPFSETDINIEGRDFNFKWSGSGTYGNIYKISSGDYPPLAFKVYCYPKGIGSHGPFGEIAIEREMTKEGVIDVPKFYMASPLGKVVRKKGDLRDYPYACWKISEFVTRDTPLKKGEMTLNKFLSKKGLHHSDRNCKNYIGSYMVDLGGVVGVLGRSFYGKYSYGNTCPITRMIDNSKFYEEFPEEFKK